jgi:branched-chain amino acid transport system permease protein
MARHARRIVTVVLLLALALVPAVAGAFGDDFYPDLFTRIMIFAIAAISLDLILGYGGMISFGHAAFLGVGAYAVGIMDHYGIDNGFAQFAVAIGAAAVLALFVGAVSLRTSGVHFIMITLAFAQMVFFLGESLNVYGGDDGMTITRHSQFAGLLNLDNPTILFFFVYALLLLVLWTGGHLVNARFGMVVQGVRSNERRMRALGFPTFRYKLAAFVISGAVCGMAGALFANQTLFVSPAIMQWSRSGEIMMMVILGGMGSLIGPLMGAAVFLMLENVLSGWTEHWQAILGPILLLVVLFARRGLFGLLPERAPGAGP